MIAKRIVFFAPVCCLLLLCLQACSGPKAQKSETKPPIQGVMEYILDNHEGLAIYSDNHFVHFAIPKHDSSKTLPLTNDEKINIYNRMIVLAGTYTVQDTIVTCTIAYHKNPNQIGNSFRYSFSIDGDILTGRVMNDKGEIVETKYYGLSDSFCICYSLINKIGKHKL